MAEQIARIEQVNIGDVWPHEAHDFTPWLSKNLDLLGSALGMKLELVQREYQVGRYYLDILAREVDRGVLVTIENQYGWSDDSHLAQLLTYTAGIDDARIAIWVAPNFEYESAEVLNWLNEWTSDEIEFYGVEVKAVRIGDSPLAADFRPVVFPDGWLKKGGRPGTSQRSQQFQEFFQPLISEMIRIDFADKAIQYFDRADRFFPSQLHSGVGYAVGFWKDHVWAALCIGLENNDLTKRVFDSLREDRDQVEESLDAALVSEWDWNMYQVSATIGPRRGGTIDDPPEKREEIRAWMIEHLPKLKEIFDPRLDKILGEETDG